MKYTIKSDSIFLEDKIISGFISIDDDKITKISQHETTNDYIDLTGFKVLPGLIDIHIHGGNGFDTMDEDPQAIEEISKFKVYEGVTSFCPTTVTASDGKTYTAINNVAMAVENGVSGSKIIGTFLEGPFISKKYKGAHPEQFINEIDLDKIKEYIKHGKGTIKSIAIAPEKENAMSAIKYICEQGLNVRIGHSDATCECVAQAVETGANIAIHTYNAMSPLNHRNPGFVGEILTNDNLFAEIICDLVHVSKKAIEVLLRCGGNKAILITDCLCAAGLKDGDYALGELDVVVKNNVARLHDGTIAGSTLPLINAVKNMNKIIGVDLLDVVKMATLNPAKALSVDNEIGSIKEGKKADIIAIDNDFNIKFVMIDGKIKGEFKIASV